MIRLLATLIWNVSEYTNIGLGRFAPYVFGLMIGAKTMKRQTDGVDECSGAALSNHAGRKAEHSYRLSKEDKPKIKGCMKGCLRFFPFKNEKLTLT